LVVGAAVVGALVVAAVPVGKHPANQQFLPLMFEWNSNEEVEVNDLLNSWQTWLPEPEIAASGARVVYGRATPDI
jgi:hypothetical protein